MTSHRERKAAREAAIRAAWVPEVRFTVIMPTVGRSTLMNAFYSVYSQLGEEDEIVLVGNVKAPLQLISRFEDYPKIRLMPFDNGGCLENNRARSSAETGTHSPDQSDTGGVERDIGQAVGRGTYFLHLDDDDVFLPGAINRIREILRTPGQDPLAIHLFRMRYGQNGQWHSRYAEFDGHYWTLPGAGKHDWRLPMHGCQWIVYPNSPLTPRWRALGEDQGHSIDHAFIRRYVKITGQEPTYHDDVIGVIRPSLEELTEILTPMTRPLEVTYAPQHGHWDGKS